MILNLIHAKMNSNLSVINELIYSFLYVLVFSFAAILIQKLYNTIPPFFSLLVSATIATIYFNLVNVGKLKHVYQCCWKEKNLCLSIMFIILIMWSCTMYGPGLIGASLYGFLNYSSMGMFGFFSLGITGWVTHKYKFYLGLCILLLIGVVSVDFFQKFSTMKIAIALILPLLAGACSFLYFKQSQILIKRVNLTATQILSFRFYLTIFSIFIFLPHNNFTLYLNKPNMLYLILLSFLSLIIPLYFLQKALEKITAEQNAIIISLSPVLTGILEEIVFKNFDLHYIYIYLLYSSILASSYFLNKYNTNQK